MLKRLIEVALPLKEVSEQSAREKSIRHGHISTLHIWWARRPLAACRAVVFASLIPDPDDPKCPDAFRKLVMDVLGKDQFKPMNGDGLSVEDTPRNRCLEFIKYLVRWENSNNPDYIQPARKLIAAAHKFLHPDAEGDAPKVLDPFAGGGSIPLEALRLGCEAHAVELNPVAHLIELCTLVYPQKYGQPDSRPVPDYIKRLNAHNRTERMAESKASLFDEYEVVKTTDSEIIPDLDITEAEYEKNPLAADIKYWGYWILKKVRQQIGKFYPNDSDGGLPVAYLWAKTVRSPNPTVDAHIPLVRQLWLCKKSDRNVALKMTPNRHTRRCEFTIVEGETIDFDPHEGTMRRGDATCPFTGAVASVAYLREQARSGKMNQQLIAVVSVIPGKSGKRYRPATTTDEKVFEQATAILSNLLGRLGNEIIPNEPISKNARGQISPPIWGIETWGELFNSRQLLALVTFSASVREAFTRIEQADDPDYAKAVATYLGLALSRFADFSSSLCLFNYTGGRGVKNTFARQALPMVWDYAESAPFNPQGANWEASIEAACGVIEKLRFRDIGKVVRGTASRLPMGDNTLAVVTDPPYYDAVPYSDLSDFFYVWQKRTLADFYPNDFRTPLTPKTQEAIQAAQRHNGDRAAAARAYEDMMTQAFQEVCRVLSKEGIACVMFAHKTTSAWETLISGLIRSGLLVTASCPIRTEKPGRVIAQDTAALASSVTLVCRKRIANAGSGIWDDTRQELKQVAQERLDFFWNQGIRGADFFISAIGPALSVFGKYERVTKLSGEEVTVGQFLDEVRSLVTNYALTKIMHTTHTAAIDPESRFYVVWKWSYGDAKVPADESFKLSQALGMHTEEMWNRTGVLEKAGENVQAVPISKRMRVKDLGEPGMGGTPASLIDVLHRLCAFREKGDTPGMAQFLGQSGQANNPTLWLVAQAISEILPDGEKKKQLMQGLLNQREALAVATRQRTLF